LASFLHTFGKRPAGAVESNLNRSLGHTEHFGDLRLSHIGFIAQREEPSIKRIESAQRGVHVEAVGHSFYGVVLVRGLGDVLQIGMVRGAGSRAQRLVAGDLPHPCGWVGGPARASHAPRADERLLRHVLCICSGRGEPSCDREALPPSRRPVPLRLRRPRES
jgi:hypothetical protein